jgi:uncharacterized phage protein gp47/JayE
MSYGLDGNGFTVKPLNVIVAEIEAQYRASYGAGLPLGPDTEMGKEIAILADRESTQWELQQAVYNAAYPNSSSDISLARIGEITAITPNGATNSEVAVYLGGTATTLVPAGSFIAVQDAGDQFALTADVTIGGSSKSVVALTRTGAIVSAEVTGHVVVAGQRVFISGADQDEYNGLVQVTNVVDPNNFEYTITTTPISPATGTINMLPMTAGNAEAVDTGPVVALAGTLNDIVTFVAGWDQVINEVDADKGAAAETDAAFRARRIAALQGLGGARLEAIRGNLLTIDGVSQALVFENDELEVDVSGRPGKSIECVVVGGTNQDIFQEIFDSKAAGIQAFGDINGNIDDSQGNQHNIGFSRAGSVLIWLEIDLTTNADFPSNGLQLVEDAVLAYGDALEIGEDVIVNPVLIGTYDDVPGITNSAIRIGIAPGPTLDNNIVIAETDIADFDSSRTTITELP